MTGIRDDRRRRWVRRAVPVVLGALAIGLAGANGTRSSAPIELRMADDVLARLQTLAGGLHNEIVLCLDGRIRGDTAFVTGFDMPTPRESTPMRSSFDPCADGTLASWHNHPLAARSATTAARGPANPTPRAARRLCVLSSTDIGTAQRLGYPFVVIAVDEATWCWWTLDEVDGFANRSISPGPPSPGRLASHGGLPSWSSPEQAASGR